MWYPHLPTRSIRYHWKKRYKRWSEYFWNYFYFWSWSPEIFIHYSQENCVNDKNKKNTSSEWYPANRNILLIREVRKNLWEQLLTTLVSRKKKKHSWNVRSTRPEENVWFHQYQPWTEIWGSSGHMFASHRLKKGGAGGLISMSLHFCWGCRWSGQNLTSTAWIHSQPAWCQQSTLWCKGISSRPTLSPFIPINHCLDTTAYQCVVADYAHLFTATIHHLLMAASGVIMHRVTKQKSSQTVFSRTLVHCASMASSSVNALQLKKMKCKKMSRNYAMQSCQHGAKSQRNVSSTLWKNGWGCLRAKGGCPDGFVCSVFMWCS